MSRARATKALWVTAAALLTLALTNAVPAAADDGAYLRTLQDRYRFLTPQQLLEEGYKVCAVIEHGYGSRYAAEMVQKDQGVSPGASMDIVSAATVHLGC